MANAETAKHQQDTDTLFVWKVLVHNKEPFYPNGRWYYGVAATAEAACQKAMAIAPAQPGQSEMPNPRVGALEEIAQLQF